MRKLLSIALCLPLAACIMGEESPGPSGDDDPGSMNDDNGDPGITGLISQDATWSGTVLIGIDRMTTRIEPGVTITVAPGTVLKFKSGVGAGLDIRGTLRIEGTKEQKVTLDSAAGDSSYKLIVSTAPTAGTLDMTYAVMTHGIIETNPGSTTTITDTKMVRARGDLLVMSGGSLTMSYSQIGPDPGETDITHCQIHTSGASTINITRSNINGAPYGMMFYGGLNAILTNNNWFANGIQIDTLPGVSGDVSGSYFDGPAPVAVDGATLTANNLSPTRLTDAGVR